MRMKNVIVSCSLFLAVFFTCSSVIYAKDAKPIIKGLKNTAIWSPPDISKGEDAFKKASIKLHFDTKVRPLRLSVKAAAQSGMRYLIEFKENPKQNEPYAVTLPVNFKCDEDLNFILDEYEDIAEGYYVQIGEYDFNNDGRPEVIVGGGDGVSYMCVNIFRYHPPEEKMRNEDWELVGKFSGQVEAIIEGQSIRLPYGSQGLESEQTWVKDKFVETGK